MSSWPHFFGPPCVHLLCTPVQKRHLLIIACAVILITADFSAAFALFVFMFCIAVLLFVLEHLTVESYTIIISLQSYLLLLVFHHPLTLSL